jgi:hypothetical protein
MATNVSKMSKHSRVSKHSRNSGKSVVSSRSRGGRRKSAQSFFSVGYS